MHPTLDGLITKTKTYLPLEKTSLIEEAYRFAEAAHRGQVRRSGEPYIEHPLQVASLLADLRLDGNTIAGAILHDVVEDCHVAEDELDRRFGPDVTKLVNGVTKLTKIEDHTAQGSAAAMDSRLHAENLRKMLVAMAEDPRVILVKLADRLHNMRTIRALPPDKRERIARETLEVYAPLAHRLGIGSVQWQLEDLAFRVLYPDRYKEVSRLLAANRVQREAFMKRVVQTLQVELEKTGIKAEISGRPKNIYSIWQKMQRYSAQGRDFDQIYDLFAARVLVEDIPTCYAALGIVHSLWHPVPGQFDDYIANPRENGYQSLHTAVTGTNTRVFEVQIRTYRMHDVAEFGLAAHFRYKEGVHHRDGAAQRFDQQMTWLRQLLEWQKEEPGAEKFLESVRTDIFQDQVYVYTPKGEVRELPIGSTPIDFAYRIHTELGHRCTGAKVNGKMVTLNTPLRNGDTVEIVVSKSEKGPSLDWLNPDLGFVKTANARDKVRAWFRRRARAENIAQGQDLLEEELRRLKIGMSEREVARLLAYPSPEDLYAALGSGALNVHQLAPKLLGGAEPAPEPEIETPVPAPVKRREDGRAPSGVMVMGNANMLTRLAQCCSPITGDRIIGFITRARGVTVHREGCRNVEKVAEPERRIPVSWGVPGRSYQAKIAIEAWDRVGLLRDVTTLLSEEKVNIASVRSTHHKRGTVSEMLTIETEGASQFSRILSQIEQIKGVIRVSRMG